MTQKSLPKVFIVGESGTTASACTTACPAKRTSTFFPFPKTRKRTSTPSFPLPRKPTSCSSAFRMMHPGKSVKATEGTGIRILDTSTAHRTKEDWVYGFPELSEQQKDAIAKADKVAVPGCHASGVISILYPLVKAGVLPINYPLHCFSLTGYSGGGKSMIKDYEENMREELKAPRQYGLSQKHKHLPEIMKVCKLCEEPIFSPIVADYVAGMQVTIGFHTHFLQLPCGLPGSVDIDDFHEIYKRCYKGSNIVKISDLTTDETNGLFLNANKDAGKDSLTIYIAGNDDRILVLASFDNLGKGASGAAIECMNIMLGFPAETGPCPLSKSGSFHKEGVLFIPRKGDLP